MQKLVILPGWGGTKETWQKFVDLAKHDFDVEVINLPCFGDEPCPKEAWGVEEYTEFVKSKIIECHSRENGNPVILLGHSFGGQVAAYFASQNSNLIDKLILFAPALLRKKPGLRSLLFGFVAKIGKLFFKLPYIERFEVWAKKLLYKAANSPDYNGTSGVKRDIFKKIIRQDLSEYLSKISVPTLLIQGTLDKYVAVKDSQKAVKLIKDAHLEIVPLARHGLHFQEPEKLLNLIKKFI